MILVGDLGGTKTILALYKHHKDKPKSRLQCLKKKCFASADFKNFTSLLADFLASAKEENSGNINIDKVCFGVAGPVVNDMCTTTHLNWILKKSEIAAQTYAKNVYLLNDLEATAWGVLDLPNSDFVTLNSASKKNQADKNQSHIAVLAAGTGLGEVLIMRSNNGYHVLATEGGHADFAPRNELEIGLLQYLMRLHPEHVSYERVVCGQGLVNIYQFLASIDYAPINPAITSRLNTEDPAAVIATAATLKNEPLCLKALDMFCTIYGAEAGNLALKCLPKGGIILAGGMAAKNLSTLQNGSFLQGYLAKGRYQSMLQDFTVKVCLNAEVGLLGAAGFVVNRET